MIGWMEGQTDQRKGDTQFCIVLSPKRSQHPACQQPPSSCGLSHCTGLVPGLDTRKEGRHGDHHQLQSEMWKLRQAGQSPDLTTSPAAVGLYPCPAPSLPRGVLSLFCWVSGNWGWGGASQHI